jgi:hypothetical protein
MAAHNSVDRAWFRDRDLLGDVAPGGGVAWTLG